MWFIGLILGLFIGAGIKGGVGALIGAILGLIAGLVTKFILNAERDIQGDDRVGILENRVNQLSNEIVRLKAQVEKLAGGHAITPPSSTVSDNNSQTKPVISPPVTPHIAMHRAPAEKSSLQAIAKTETKTPFQPSAATTPLKTESDEPSIWANLMSGNILAKIGVVILFFGIASALKLAVEHGMFPVSIRLLLGSVIAAAMILFGWSRATNTEHRMFGLALQGGGFGVLYLLVYFMLSWYHYIDYTTAFILFMLLGVVCILMAAFQNGASLAVLGISGAFLAPVLASSGSNNYVGLFTYYALLNTFIFSVNWFKNWRSLNITGFLFTFVVGMMWALDSYRPEFFATVEFFLLLFFVMYSAVPVLFALFKAPGTKIWAEGIIVFGTPIAAAICQTPLMKPYEYGLAWSAFGAGLYYILLWRLLMCVKDDAIRVIEKSHLAIAIAFLTVTIPLAFNIQATVAFWAIEGCAVLWLGVTQDRWRARIFGIVLQFIAAIYFLAHYPQLAHQAAIFNDRYIGGLIIAIAGFISAAVLRNFGNSKDQKETSSSTSGLILYWGLLWWWGSGIVEIIKFVINSNQIASTLGLIAATILIMETIGKMINWNALRTAAPILILAIVITTIINIVDNRPILQNFMLVVLPLSLILHYWILARHEQDSIAALIKTRHIIALWLLTWIAGHELAWLSHKLAPDNHFWPLMSWGISALVFSRLAMVTSMWPFASYSEYRGIGIAPILFFIFIWSIWTNFTNNGGGSGLSYIPLISVFDILQLATAMVFFYWANQQESDANTQLGRVTGYFLVFIWLSTMAARIAHHYGDIPFRFNILFASTTFQAMLSLLWTLTAIVIMIAAAKKIQRTMWFGGLALLAVVGIKLLLIDLPNKGTIAWTASLIGIGILLLGASYFAPRPPEE